MTIRLFYNYYEDKNLERKKEIDFCLDKNINNQYIKTIIIESNDRLKFNDYFNRINKITEDNDINIICNSDIFFDETIQLCEKMNNNDCYALLRYEYDLDGNITFHNRPDSQDVFITKGKVNNVNGNFYLGIGGGIDNRISWEFKHAGYNVINPCLSIKTYHYHNSNIRNYTNKDTVPPPYLQVHPCKL